MSASGWVDYKATNLAGSHTVLEADQNHGEIAAVFRGDFQDFEDFLLG